MLQKKLTFGEKQIIKAYSMWAFGHVDMRTCGHAHMWRCRHAHMWTCGHVDMWTCAHVHMSTCRHVHMRTWRHADMRTCGHADMRTCGARVDPGSSQVGPGSPQFDPESPQVGPNRVFLVESITKSALRPHKWTLHALKLRMHQMSSRKNEIETVLWLRSPRSPPLEALKVAVVRRVQKPQRGQEQK